jgi:hypothetical protein
VNVPRKTTREIDLDVASQETEVRQENRFNVTARDVSVVKIPAQIEAAEIMR